jgi:magnesium chelatase family protein
MKTKQMRAHCQLDGDSQELLRHAISKLGLSGRSYDRILKVARTIADLNDIENIQAQHIAEAIQYRTLDRK